MKREKPQQEHWTEEQWRNVTFFEEYTLKELESIQETDSMKYTQYKL